MPSIDELIRFWLSRKLKKKRKSAAQVSSALRGDGGRNYLGRKIRGDQKLTTEDLTSVAEFLEISTEEFSVDLVATVAPQRLADSVLQAPMHLAPSRYSKILLQLAAPKPDPEATRLLSDAVPEYYREPIPRHLNVLPSRTVHKLLQQIDEHPKVAFELAKKEVLTSASSSPGGKPEAVLEHASLLNAWAVAARRVGRVSLAAILTAEALELHGSANLSRTYPPLLRTLIAILDEIGEQEYAMAAAQHCILHSWFAEDGEGVAKSALALSRVHLRAGDFELAIRALSSEALAPEGTRFRVNINLAYAFFQQGKLNEAQSLLDQIEPASKYETLHKMHLSAKLLSRRAPVSATLQAYEELIEASAHHLQPSYRLMLFLELVPLLREYGQVSAIKLFASHFFDDLERLELNRATEALREDVLNAATHGILREGIEIDYQRSLVQDV
ncbi:MAG: hypothetical protein AAGC60_23565 [Acidobacteriota bacterium]